MGSDFDRKMPTEGDGPEQQERLRLESFDFGKRILPQKTAAKDLHERAAKLIARKAKGETPRPGKPTRAAYEALLQRLRADGDIKGVEEVTAEMEAL
jgi:hypothetical protein